MNKLFLFVAMIGIFTACSKDDARAVAAQEIRRSKWDVAAAPAAPTTTLALAVLYVAGAVSPTLAAACRRATEP